MNNVFEMPKSTDGIDEAGTWIARLDRKLSTEDEQALQKWLAADPKNPAALVEVARLWDKMDSLSRLADLFPESAMYRPRVRRYAYGMAASIALAILVAIWTAFNLRPAAPARPVVIAGTPSQWVYQTAVGEHSTINLPDGSQLTLNTNSLVRVAFTRRRRVLKLVRGEVYVRAVHDKSRPLNVYAGDKVVEDVGTEFDLQISQNNQIELIVTKGKVLVGVIDKKTASSAKDSGRPGALKSAVPVSAGEQLLLSDSAEKVKPIKSQDIAVKLSWRGGNLIFRGESLQKALNEIERYTPVEFVIQDENLKRIRIVGMFKTGDVRGLLTTLRKNFDITYQRVGNDKVILSNKSTQ